MMRCTTIQLQEYVRLSHQHPSHDPKLLFQNRMTQRTEGPRIPNRKNALHSSLSRSSSILQYHNSCGFCIRNHAGFLSSTILPSKTDCILAERRLASGLADQTLPSFPRLLKLFFPRLEVTFMDSLRSHWR